MSVHKLGGITRGEWRPAYSRELAALLDRVVRVLQAGRDLPEGVAPPGSPAEAGNPFA